MRSCALSGISSDGGRCRRRGRVAPFSALNKRATAEPRARGWRSSASLNHCAVCVFQRAEPPSTRPRVAAAMSQGSTLLVE